MSIHTVVAWTTSVTVWKKVQDWVSVLRQLCSYFTLIIAFFYLKSCNYKADDALQLCEENP